MVLGCRNAEDGEPIAQQIVAAGGRAQVSVVDVSDYASVDTAVATACAFGQGLTGVVNNAAVISPIARLDETDPAAWTRAIQVNLVGPYHGIRAGLPRLSDGGVIINLSSGAADIPLEGWSAYCASKAGLAMLTRSTHLEHGSRVRVYGAQPGMVDTDMQAEIRASGLGAVSRVPSRNLSLASSPSRAIAWLLRHAPEDLSGTEVDLEAIALRLRIGRESRMAAQ